MVIVEFQNEIDQIKEKLQNNTSIWFPMWVDANKHTLNNELSFIFIRCNGEDYVLPHLHVDALSIPLDTIQNLINSTTECHIIGKKKLGHTLDITDVNAHDVVSRYYVETNEVLDIVTPFEALFKHHFRNGFTEDWVRTTSLLKIVETIQQIVDKCGKYTTKTDNPNYIWLNEKVIPTLQKIEQFGLKVDTEKFSDRYSEPHLIHLTKDNIIYTEYNPYILTGRPSNRHGGINYSALNKDDGSREVFIPHGAFLQMDYDAYHIRLISKLIKYEIPHLSGHQYLADQYGTDYASGKAITFRLLYGGIDDEFRVIPFFDKTADYIEKLWIKTEERGYIQTPNRRIPLGWIENPNPQKCFNYLLQSIETERNIEILDKVLKYISNSDVKLPLYTYDAFLFDFKEAPTAEWVTKLKEVIEEGGFPVKMKWGTDYGKV